MSNRRKFEVSFHIPTRHELSVHEAGHAYAFAALRWPDEPAQIGLGVDEAGAHHGWSRRSTILYKEVRLRRDDPETLAYQKWCAAAEIVVLFAGPLAEFRHRHRSRMGAAFLMSGNVDVFLHPGSFDQVGDFEGIRAALAYVEAKDARSAFLELLWIADEILAANWPLLRRLAAHLRERDVLDADEVVSWFESEPVRRWEQGARLRDALGD